jgi:transposase-like protein
VNVYPRHLDVACPLCGQDLGLSGCEPDERGESSIRWLCPRCGCHVLAREAVELEIIEREGHHDGDGCL